MNLFLQWIKTLLRWMMMMLLIPLTVVVILSSPLGLKLGFAIISKMAPGELHYRSVNGALTGSLMITNLSYRYHDQQFSTKKLFIEWQPLALLAGKFLIENIELTDVTLTIPNPTVNIPQKITIESIKKDLQQIRETLVNLHLPINLQIKKGHINQVKFGHAANIFPIQIHNIYFSGVIYPETLKIDFAARLFQPYPLDTHLTIDGSPKNYRFQIKASNPETYWVVTGSSTPEKIQFNTQQALLFSGKLDIQLTWNWDNPNHWDLKLSGQHLDLSKIHPDLPHTVDAQIESIGTLGKDHPHFSWKAFIKTQKNQIQTQGQYDQQWDASWDLTIGQLAELLPFSSGSIKSTGELHGALKRPITKGVLQANLLNWKGYRVDKLSAHWNFDITQKTPSQFQLEASQLFAPSFQIQNIQMNGSGKWDQHQLHAKIKGYDTDLELSLTGSLGTQEWKGSLKQFSIFAPHAGQWRLTQPTALYLSPKRVDITAMCLQSTYQSQFCIRGQWQGSDRTWQAFITSHLNLQQLATLLPEHLAITVPIDLFANIQGKGKDVQFAQVTSKSGKGYIRYTKPNQNIQTEITSATLNAKVDQTGGSANLQIILSDQNTLSGSLTLPHIDLKNVLAKNQELQGQIKIHLTNLSLLQTFIPDIVATSGQFEGSFDMRGTIGEPLISGSAQLERGQLKIPGLNIQLNNINLSLDAKGKELSYTLTAVSDNQPLKLVGKTDLSQSGLPTQLNLTGEKVLLANTPLYLIYASPNINIKLQGDNIDISGNVDIPKAILYQLEFQPETVLPAEEVVFIGEHPVIKKSSMNVSTQLTINLGNDVTVDSPGLKAKLGGSVTLISNPGQVMLGVGKIELLHGTYEVSGRKLTITPNSAIVYRRNPINNPSLSIQATIMIDITDPFSQQQLGTNELTVGMNVGGTSSSPQVTLFSSAGNLSQADMLSYLLLGTPSGGISPTNMNLLLQALNTLPLTKKGSSGVEGLTNQIKQSLGFSEFGVESAATFGPTGEPIPTTGTTSYFVVGKRITTRVYLRYKYDPFNSVNLFQLNYYFSKNWSLQFETDGNNQSGADILYTIETGNPKSATKTTEKPK